QALLRELGGPAWLARWGAGHATEAAVPVWTTTQKQEAIDSKVAQKLAELRVQREVEPHTLPPNAANLAGLVGTWVVRCLAADSSGHRLHVEHLPASATGKRSPYDLIVQQRQPANDA